MNHKTFYLALGYVLSLFAAILVGYMLASYLKPSRAVLEPSRATEEVQVPKEEKDCLYEALWYEARGENPEGIKAVAEVILNRVEHKAYPNSFCKVIKQKAQFSYTLKPYRNADKIKASLKEHEQPLSAFLDKVVENTTQNKIKRKFTPTTLWYARVEVRNAWTAKKRVQANIGNHTFYYI